MSVLTDLIRLDKHRIRRKLYIDRRLLSGAYEGAWTRIDNWHGSDVVTDWGSVSINIDQQPNVFASVNPVIALPFNPILPIVRSPPLGEMVKSPPDDTAKST